MALTFLDTDVLIALARADKTALARVREHAHPSMLGLASTTVAEFLRGIPPGVPAHDVQGLLEAFQEVPFGPRASREFGRMMWLLDRGGRRIPTADGLIAATVLAEGGSLLTRNLKDYERVPGLVVVQV